MSCKQEASEQQDARTHDQRKHTYKPMGRPSRQETALSELVRVRDACHIHMTSEQALSFLRCARS